MSRGLQKAERMERRRATGSRVVRPIPPQRIKGAAYLIAHACFECRKSWRLPLDSAPVCRECDEPLREMGRSFKTPAKTNTEQWDKVRALWEAGFRFWSYRSVPDAEPLPARLRDIEAFIRRNPAHPLRTQASKRSATAVATSAKISTKKPTTTGR